MVLTMLITLYTFVCLFQRLNKVYKHITSYSTVQFTHSNEAAVVKVKLCYLISELYIRYCTCKKCKDEM